MIQNLKTKTPNLKMSFPSCCLKSSIPNWNSTTTPMMSLTILNWKMTTRNWKKTKTPNWSWKRIPSWRTRIPSWMKMIPTRTKKRTIGCWNWSLTLSWTS